MQYSKIISILIVSVGLASAAVGTSKSDSKNNNNNNSNRKNNNNNNASNVTVTTTTTTRHHNGAVVEDMSVFGSLAALAAGVLLM
ncbi:hypothetical protein Cantr_03744 [Candida viswanathii]|uniref:Alsin helical array domain-containing protein n=1 Tax=Candida viswanathii TaxID=5486 RepID=A0A367XNK6_9ASCO|nr:hypothetical protein Cantr_03744 [Candida viswanathii]